MKYIITSNQHQSEKMTAIKSLYIPHVENHFNAEFIVDLFNKTGLAKVSRVYMKPKTKTNLNRVYIQIESWHETEAAYSFIQRLRNPSTEARLVYSDDNWWVVDINKTFTFTSNRVLTVFTKQVEYDDDCSNVAVGIIDEDEFVIDAEKTKMIRDIVAKFKENHERQLEQEEADAAEFDSYLRRINWARELTLGDRIIW
jgi:hypothetical protein